MSLVALKVTQAEVLSNDEIVSERVATTKQNNSNHLSEKVNGMGIVDRYGTCSVVN